MPSSFNNPAGYTFDPVLATSAKFNAAEVLMYRNEWIKVNDVKQEVDREK
jgi:hypothetical protein